LDHRAPSDDGPWVHATAQGQVPPSPLFRHTTHVIFAILFPRFPPIKEPKHTASFIGDSLRMLRHKRQTSGFLNKPNTSKKEQFIAEVVGTLLKMTLIRENVIELNVFFLPNCDHTRNQGWAKKTFKTCLLLLYVFLI